MTYLSLGAGAALWEIVHPAVGFLAFVAVWAVGFFLAARAAPAVSGRGGT